MQTSYFAKSGTHPNAIAISARVPEFYKGARYTKLAPSWSIYSEWKNSTDHDEFKNEQYSIRFYNEILSKLNPKEVYEELCALVEGEPILICYESPGKFCHRHIIAIWLSVALNIEIIEI